MEIQAGMTAFVTGAGGGMGLAMARSFAEAGMRVMMADVDAGRVETAAAELAASGADVRPLQLDVRDPDAWSRASEEAWAWSGGVQILCNNAGVVFQGRLTEQSIDVWRLTQAVNVDGPYFGIRAFLPRMLESGREGRIVNTASLAGLWGETKLATYTASKFALVGLSEALQLEVARTRVGVTVVFPGPTATELGATTYRMAQAAGVLPQSPPETDGAPPRRAPPVGIDPRFIGERVLQAIRDDEFYVITHPDWRPVAEARCAALLAAFGEPADSGHADDSVMIEKVRSRLAAAVGRGP